MLKALKLATTTLFFVPFIAFTQVQTAQNFELENATIASTAERYALFEQLHQHDYSFEGILEEAEVLRLRPQVLKKLYQKAPKHARLLIPAMGGGSVELHLERNDRLIHDLRVKTRTASGLYAHPYRESFHYWGKVAGQDTSLVGVSVFEDHITVMYSTPGADYNLGPAYNDPKQHDYIQYRGQDLLPVQGTACKVKEHHHEHWHHWQAHKHDHGHQLRNIVSCKTLRMYLEVGVSLYNDLGSNVTNSVDYVLSLYNMIALTFEVHGMPHVVSEIVVNSVATPVESEADIADALDRFDDQLVAAGGVNGDLAQYMTSKSTGSYSGGIAWLGSICFFPQNTGINASFVPNFGAAPSYSWNVTVVAHEAGHNHANPHTQRCSAWGTPARRYDDCFSDEGSGNCASIQTLSPGSDMGSIMSYCHIGESKNDFPPNPVGVSLTVGFADLPGENANAFFQSRPCLTCPCIDEYGPTYSIATAHTGIADLDEVTRTERLNPTLQFNPESLFDLGRPSDYFQLRATDNGTLNLTMRALPENFELELLQPDGTVLASSTNPGLADENISQALAIDDTVYVRVFNVATAFNTSCTPYELEIDWVPVSACDNAGLDSTIYACNSGTVNLLTNGLAGSPAAGGTWTDVDAAGGLSGNVLDLAVPTAGADYRFEYTVGGGACPTRMATVTVNVDACTPTCIPSYTTSCAADPTPDFFFINTYCIRSTSGNLSKSSATDVSCNRYTDNTGTVVSGLLSVCDVETMTVQIAVDDAFAFSVAFAPQIYVYMDWNQDGDFLDTDEENLLTIQDFYENCSGGSFSLAGFAVAGAGSITIPASFEGGHVLMRLQMGKGMGGPCGTSTDDGETEDYLLFIPPAPELSPKTVSPATQTICENCRAFIDIEDAERNQQYALYDGTTAVSDTFVATGNMTLTIPVQGLGVSTHTLTARQVAANCDGSDLDMTNTVDVVVSNTFGSGPATENDPGMMFSTNEAAGAAPDFDGTGIAFLPDTMLDLSNSTDGFTVSTWFWPTNLGAAVAGRKYTLISKAITLDEIDYEIGIRYDGTNHQVYAITGDPVVEVRSDNVNIAVGNWYHIAAVKDAAGANLRIYLNGEEVTYATGPSLAGSTANVDYRQWLSIGRASTDGQRQQAPNYFSGYIDETVLHNTALSEDDVRERMHLIREGCTEDIVAYFQYNTIDSNRFVFDRYNRVQGEVLKSEGDQPLALVPSTLPVGKGESERMNGINADGLQAFGATNVEIDFTGVTGNYDIVVSRLDIGHNPNTTLPDATHPTLEELMAAPYYVVNQFGTGSFASADMTFSEVAPVVDEDITIASNLKLLSRDSRAIGAWGPMIDANSAVRQSVPQQTAEVVFQGITGFSQFGIGTTTENVLPVELLSFDVQRENTNDALLHWETATEINNYGFAIEMQRPNAKTFEQATFVPGHGSTTEAKQYTHTVYDLEPGLYFFRLRQIDFDGTESFSELRQLHILDDDRPTELVVYPNPNDGSFTISGAFAEGTTATISNLLGQRIWSGELFETGAKLTLPVSKGVYLLQVIDPQQAYKAVRMVVE